MTPDKTEASRVEKELTAALAAQTSLQVALLETQKQLAVALNNSTSTNATLLQSLKDRDDLVYRFLFIGEPEKGIQGFVPETRDKLAWLDGFKVALWRVVWIAVGAVITLGVGALFVWRFPPQLP